MPRAAQKLIRDLRNVNWKGGAKKAGIWGLIGSALLGLGRASKPGPRGEGGVLIIIAMEYRPDLPPGYHFVLGTEALRELQKK